MNGGGERARTSGSSPGMKKERKNVIRRNREMLSDKGILEIPPVCTAFVLLLLVLGII